VKEAVAAPVLVNVKDPLPRRSASQTLTLLGSVDGVSAAGLAGWRFQWAETVHGLDLAAIGASASGVNLVVPPGSLQGGLSYSFQLSASEDASGQAGAASISVGPLNTPPRGGGACTVVPASGLALNTSFVASAAGWVDDAEDLPLRYTFRAQAGVRSSSSLLIFRRLFRAAAPRRVLSRRQKRTPGCP